MFPEEVEVLLPPFSGVLEYEYLELSRDPVSVGPSGSDSMRLGAALLTV